MNILSIQRNNKYIKVLTDNVSRPEFAYPADKFDNIEDLEAEINRSIAQEAARETKRQEKVDKINADLSRRTVNARN
jgi:hypothetical protein